MPRRLLIIGLSVFLLCFAAACSDDDDCPTCPGDEAPADPEPTIANVWPHADGNRWIYDLQLHGFEGDPDDELDPEEPVPDLPTMEELRARLDQPVPNTPLGDSEGLYRMSFAGEVTTDSGVTAQLLREELFTPEGRTRRLAPRSERLRALALAARPDLRRDASKATGDDLDAPTLMGGYAFEADETGIYSYGDLNAQHSWIYLEADLSLDHEFSIQLIPDLADDVFLYGRIWSVGDVELGGTTYANAVECFYVIDFGDLTATDEDGNLLFRMRSYLYGSVIYAPGIGPVWCHERAHTVDPWFVDLAPVILEREATISGLQVAP